MLAVDLINYDIPVLKPTDTVARAMELMNNARMSQLVVADGGTYLGMVEEDLLLDYDEGMMLNSVAIDYLGVFALGFQHLYELLGTASRYDLTCLAVLEEDQKFTGTIVVADLYQRFAELIGTYEPGAIIEMNLNNRDYSLSEISRLIESENAKVTGSYITGNTQDYENPLRLTLKLNKTDISSIVATLERFGYTIDATYAHTPFEHVDQQRYDMLMKYLSI